MPGPRAPWEPASYSRPEAGPVEWRPVGAPARWTRVSEAPAGPPPEARKEKGNAGWDIMLGLDFAVIIASLAIGMVAYFVWISKGTDILGGTEDLSAEAARLALVLNTALNIVLFGLIPFGWVWGTRVGGWHGAIRYLHLGRPWPAVGMGVPLAVVLVIVALVVSILLEARDLSGPTPNTEALTRALTWPIAIFVAFVAGTTEEILFRGVVQRFIGVSGQAAVFGLFHLPNGPVALIVTAAIGLIFGLLVQRGHSLWLVMTAHFAYDMILLSLALLFPEFANPEDPVGLVRLFA